MILSQYLTRVSSVIFMLSLFVLLVVAAAAFIVDDCI